MNKQTPVHTHTHTAGPGGGFTDLQREAVRVIMEATDEQIAEALQLWREWKEDQEKRP